MKTRQLTNDEAKQLSHWFTQIDENTIELKEKRWGAGKVLVLLLLFFIYAQGLMSAKYGETNIHILKFTFMPKTRFEQNWNDHKLLVEMGLSSQRSEKEFKASMWKKYKHRVKYGYYMLLPWVFFLLIGSIPSKRRIRFDRRRGIIYTYDRGKLHVTEINKLMRPLSEYIRLDIYGVHMWVHPYRYPKGMERLFAWQGFMTFSDASIWKNLFNFQFQNSQAFLMQEIIVEFMNPATKPERVQELMRAINLKSHWSRMFLTWLEMGIYCKPLPKESVLEKELAHYFKEVAPTIEAHPSWFYWHDESRMRIYRKGMFFIVKVETNRLEGYTEVPCPTLFEIPEQSMHSDSAYSIENYRDKRNENLLKDNNDE
ncbi:MAG: hypothetical protein KGV46_02245 [Pasteurella sp.]|nr:hypothetical protein [Pasteurella sp.]